MCKKESWIPWKQVGFTEKEIEEHRKNPIKSSCGVCKKDLTGLESKDVHCNSKDCPVHNYSF